MIYRLATSISTSFIRKVAFPLLKTYPSFPCSMLTKVWLKSHSLHRKMSTIFVLLIMYHLWPTLSAVNGGLCRGQRSQRGFALLNKTYRSNFVQRYPDCVDLCVDDPRCMSFNFWWDTRKCDLNTRSKEHSCRACLVPEPLSTYMGMERYSGKTLTAIVTTVKGPVVLAYIMTLFRLFLRPEKKEISNVLCIQASPLYFGPREIRCFNKFIRAKLSYNLSDSKLKRKKKTIISLIPSSSELHV